ncbi:hypothetical protein SAMN02746066_04506 [Anaerosporobacter mobilis DSM 15930]|jgi:hypothetical protein|uniref:Uncharacterized protein n=1 Tax=Anaerosporobacter mobilis DSM 15930 TaxID=1120996 RepID=A0A1M7NJ82_9FIRM|nr:hypothetical protein [Anaerosporobacter mobilis]SHN03324.1 hypothetical protein SAMN02746066_04506 [Anaerosporobacter mobilis DSM 15930]
MDCKTCTIRYLGCHDHCETYIERRKELDDVKKQKKNIAISNSYCKAAIHNMSTRRGKRFEY